MLVFRSLAKMTWIAAVALLAALPAQQQKSDVRQGDYVIRSGANEVLLDVIVRDQRGKPVRDLKPDEIKVFEDGVEQQIASFRMIDGSTGRVVSSNDQVESGKAVDGERSSSRADKIRCA